MQNNEQQPESLRSEETAAPAVSDMSAPSTAMNDQPTSSTGPSNGFIGYRELIGVAFRFPLQNSSVFGAGFGIMLLSIILIGGLGLFAFGEVLLAPEGMAPALSPLKIALFIAGYICFLLVMSLISFAIMRALLLRNQSIGVWDSLIWSLKKVVPISVVLLLVQLSTSGATILLVIPGIALGIYTAFAILVYISEGRTGVDALLRSINLVYGHWWGVLLRIFAVAFVAGLCAAAVSGIAFLLLSLISPILVGVLVPVIWVYLAAMMMSVSIILYESLIALKPQSNYDANTYSKAKIFIYITVALGVLLMAFQVFSAVVSLQSGYALDGRGDGDFNRFIEQLEQMQKDGEFDNAENFTEEELQELQQKIESAMSAE